MTLIREGGWGTVTASPNPETEAELYNKYKERRDKALGLSCFTWLAIPWTSQLSGRYWRTSFRESRGQIDLNWKPVSFGWRNLYAETHSTDGWRNRHPGGESDEAIMWWSQHWKQAATQYLAGEKWLKDCSRKRNSWRKMQRHTHWEPRESHKKRGSQKKFTCFYCGKQGRECRKFSCNLVGKKNCSLRFCPNLPIQREVTGATVYTHVPWQELIHRHLSEDWCVSEHCEDRRTGICWPGNSAWGEFLSKVLWVPSTCSAYQLLVTQFSSLATSGRNSGTSHPELYYKGEHLGELEQTVASKTGSPQQEKHGTARIQSLGICEPCIQLRTQCPFRCMWIEGGAELTLMDDFTHYTCTDQVCKDWEREEDNHSQIWQRRLPQVQRTLWSQAWVLHSWNPSG